jgi:hypothetical protein
VALAVKGLAAEDSADSAAADTAVGGADSDAAASAAALDGVLGLVGDSDSAGAASGIRTGGDRAGAWDGVRRTHIITPTRIGRRMARLILTTTGAVRTTRLGRTVRQPTHLATTIPRTVRTPAV